MENKKFDFKVEEGFLVITADPNQDGQPLVYIKIDIAEIPDEVLSALKK